MHRYISHSANPPGQMFKNDASYRPYGQDRANRLLQAGLTGALLIGAFAIGFFLLGAFDSSDTSLAKTGSGPSVLGTSVEREPVLIPPDLTAPPTTVLAPINTLPPSLSAPLTTTNITPLTTTPPPTTAPPTTGPITTAVPGTAVTWPDVLVATIAAHPVLDGRREDELRSFVDSICAAQAAGASDQFITEDLARQAAEKGWSAELAEAVQALRVAGTAVICPR